MTRLRNPGGGLPHLGLSDANRAESRWFGGCTMGISSDSMMTIDQESDYTLELGSPDQSFRERTDMNFSPCALPPIPASSTAPPTLIKS